MTDSVGNGRTKPRGSVRAFTRGAFSPWFTRRFCPGVHLEVRPGIFPGSFVQWTKPDGFILGFEIIGNGRTKMNHAARRQATYLVASTSAVSVVAGSLECSPDVGMGPVLVPLATDCVESVYA